MAERLPTASVGGPTKGDKGTALGLIHLRERADGVSVIEQLRHALMANFSRVADLFSDWDEDANGTVSKKEFRQVLPIVGVRVARTDADALFDTLDVDGSGAIDYRELYHHLRAGSTVELDASLQVGAAGEITLAAQNQIALRDGLRHTTTGSLGGAGLFKDADGDGLDDSTGEAMSALVASGASLVARLKAALDRNLARAIDLFREWDDDGNGTVSRREVRGFY